MPASAIRSLLADATLAARLRLWIVIVGVLVIVLFVSSSAYDSWRSYRQVITATNRPPVITSSQSTQDPALAMN